MEPAEKNILDAATAQAELAKTHAEAALQSVKDAAASALASAKSAEAAAALNPAATASSKQKGKPLRSFVTDFDYYSGKASEISRSLGLAGIGIIWIFRNPDGPSTALLPKPLFAQGLLYPLACLALSLFLDLLQYVIGYGLWRGFYLRKLAEVKDEDVIFETPDSYVTTLRVFFYAKMAFMLAAYVLIFVFLGRRIFGI